MYAGQIVKDWDAVDFENEQHWKKLMHAFAYYLAKPSDFGVPGVVSDVELQNFRREKQKIYQLQNISQIDDFVERINTLMGSFKTMDIYDEGYKAIYEIAPLSGDNGWDVRTITDSIVFSEMKEGQHISYYGWSDAIYRAYVKFYGGGVGIDRQTILSRQYANVEEGIMRLRNAAYLKMAAVAYALIEAIGAGQNIAWQTAVPAVAVTDYKYNALRDALTIDLATRTLYENNKDKGIMPRGLNTPFVILYPYQLDFRIRGALSVPMEAYMGSEKILNFNYVTVKTDMLSASNVYYVLIPKGKTQGRELLNLTQFAKFNQDNFQEQIADWMAFGFNIGDEEQFQRCLTA